AIGAEGGNLDLCGAALSTATFAHQDHTKGDADLLATRKKCEHLFRPCRGCNVEILRFAAHHTIAHASAGKIRYVAGALKSLNDDAGEFFRGVGVHAVNCTPKGTSAGWRALASATPDPLY